MHSFNYFLTKLSASAAGSDATLNPDKVALILRGLILVSIFILVFSFVYLRYTADQPKLRRLFYWSSGILFFVIIGKYALYHFYKGYIPDRLPMYALPSPKSAGVLWFILPSIVFGTYLYLRKKITALKTNTFLLTLWVTFTAFALSVAATREGLYSIYERFSRTYWEYTGNLYLVKGFFDFLHNYTALTAELANHAITHPPGFTLLLYLAQSLFHVSYLGLSIFVVILGGLSVFPVYYLLREFAGDVAARRAVEIFVFLPSFALLGATSMDVTFLLATALTIALLSIGWKRNASIALLGGVAAGVALFMNFLFLLLAPLFFYLVYLWWTSTPPEERKISRIIFSIAGFAGWWLCLYWLTDYSIITNFFIARQVQGQVVASNFASAGMYALFALMNITSFFFYLGIANVILLGKKMKTVLDNKKILGVGFVLVIFFVLIGIFQGEVERIWLFLLPWFLLPIVKSIEDLSDQQFGLLLSLSFFQIIITQTLFYTYW